MTFTDLVIILFILALLAYAYMTSLLCRGATARCCWPFPCFAAAALTA
jgi:hypothetical protein